jgi:hypothetical protein
MIKGTPIMALTRHSLRDHKSFPSFTSCPGENDVDLTYYRLDGSSLTPRSHWCFLGEITDRIVFNRLCLTVKDKHDILVPTNFHLDSRGPRIFTPGMSNFPVHPNLPQALVDKGNTIAILYPHQHPFMDGSVGFRIEDADLVQVWILFKRRGLFFKKKNKKKTDLLDFPLQFGTTLLSQRSHFK